MFAVAVVASLVLLSVALASFVGALVNLILAAMAFFETAYLGRGQYLNVIAFVARPSLMMLKPRATRRTRQKQISVLANPEVIETDDWAE